MDWRVFSIFLFVFTNLTNAGRMKIDNDGGYFDMVIAIRDDVKESSELLDAIRREFRLASSHLYNATRKMTYFKEIRILIPPSWKNEYKGCEETTWESYYDADVLIRPKIGTKHVPYVKGYGPCGTPGSHMFLTPEFISDHENGKRYGRPQKTIVHEFGHLRWGLKDEYPYPNQQHYYRNSDTKKVEATRCVGAIIGNITLRGDAHQLCSENSKDGLPDKDHCYFRANRSATNYKACIMYRSWLPDVTEFCDGGKNRDEIDPSIRHNIQAPNRQNQWCNYQSCWEMMRKHSDFSGRNGPSPVRNIDPSFKLIRQARNTSMVFVLDTSGSMEGNRMKYLRWAAEASLEDVLPLGTRLGIVTFNSSAFITTPIIPVETSETRQRLNASLPNNTGGDTSIGAGMRLATQMLKNETVRVNKQIIVVSDGEENTSPRISDVMEEVKAANISVNTIALGNDADKSFEDLASATNGQSFLNSEGFTSLYLSFFQSIRKTEEEATISGAPVVLKTVSHSSQSGSKFSESFYIDEALTGDLKVIIHSLNSTFEGRAMLADPSGTLYKDTSDAYHEHTNMKQGTFIINQDDVKVGMWHLTIANLGNNDKFEVVIQPSVADEVNLITATASVALNKIKPPERQTIYVAVSKDLTPVIKAKVTATISVAVEGGTKDTKVYPLDNGAGADMDKDDGVYSIFFTKFTSPGRYSVQVLVEGTPDTQLANGALLGGGSSVREADIHEDIEEILYEPTGPFQREVIGQTFVCEGEECAEATTSDLYPPNEIMDLTATNINPGNNTITLSFTAPGDDLSDGTASEYEFRYSSEFSDIVYAFNETDLIPADWFISGNPRAPKEAGTKETFVIGVNRTGTYNIAVVAIDDGTNRSKRSNIATSSSSLLFSQPPIRDSVHGRAISTGLVAAVVFVHVVVIIIAVRSVCQRKKKNSPTLLPFRT